MLGRQLKSAIHGSDHSRVIDICAKLKESDKTVENIIMALKPKLAKVKHVPLKMWSNKECYNMAKQMKIKHLYKIRTQQMFNIDNDPIRSVNFTLYHSLLKKANIDIWNKYQIYDRAHNQKDLKDLGEWAKNNGPEIKDWTYLVDIANLWGWRPVEHGEKIVEKITNWVSTIFTPTYNGSSEEFLKRFRSKVREILHWRQGSLENELSIEQYCRLIPVMGTTGSAYDPERRGNITVQVDGVEISPNKNKYTKTLAMSQEEREHMLRTNTSHNTNVSLKQEIFPKVRTIVSLEYALAEQQRYVDQWLKRWMSGNGISNLWSNNQQKVEMWQRMADMLGINVPIDQSAFDTKVSKLMIKIINDEILRLIRERATNGADLELVMGKIIVAMEGGVVHYQEPGGKRHNFEYKNGVLSGWQWTAFYDTVVNIAEMRLAEDICRERGIEIETILENCQGDDQLKTVKTWAQALAYWAAMSSLGLEINYQKNFFSSKHNEYLRKWATVGEVNGYPARMINGLCWLYPGQREQLPPIAKTNAIFANWTKLEERMRVRTGTFKQEILNDLRGAKLSHLSELGYISRTTGGQALWNKEDKLVTVTTSGEVSHSVKIISRGFTEFEQEFGQYQERELKQWTERVIGVTDYIDKTFHATEEVKVANIVLKELPFMIGTARMPVRPGKIDGFPNDVIFGKSDELMKKIFPTIDTTYSLWNAPKSWVKQWVKGETRVVVPRIEGWSDEFLSMYSAQYHGSIYTAMMNKRPTNNKWMRLNRFWEDRFVDNVVSARLHLVRG